MSYYHDFDPSSLSSIVLKFRCIECGKRVVSDEMDVPYPDCSSETIGDSRNSSSDYIYCGHCDKGYTIEIGVTYVGGRIDIEDLEESANVEFTGQYGLDFNDYGDFDKAEFEAIIANKDFYKNFTRGISDLRELNSINTINTSARQALSKQIYIGTITCLETYLADAFINTVLDQEKYLRDFFKTFPIFKGQTIEISNIFGYVDKVKDEAKKEMRKVLYHNLPFVTKMYKVVLDVTFPLSSLIHRAVKTRHDLVHRNGKNIEDNAEVYVDAEIITELLTEIESFVGEINTQVFAKAWEMH